MSNVPTGIVTFLFTDIEGSTMLSQQFPESLPAALDIHNKILRDAIESNNGFIFEVIGDALCASFKNADDAVKAAVDSQTGLTNEMWSNAVIKVRIGIHSGKAEWTGKNYIGYITLARTARVMSAAYGEQIIISDDAYNQLKESQRFNGLITFRDLGERRLKDVIKSIKLYQITAPQLKVDFPPLETLDARPNNLPVQLTNFIGREKELNKVKDLLSDTRLLTLTGSGGAGKSRLALQIGADLIDEFVNGVWIAELAPVSDPKMLPKILMEVLGVKEENNKTLDQTLTGYLKDKEILFIIDNCEQLINECAKMVENLLSACPKLKIISTSREALKCSGEQIFNIPALSCPDHDSNETPEQLTKYESVRLFIERALALNQEFKVTNENAPALAGICSRLDGIPLAIELAAARTKILTLDKIYKKLDDRFKLLTGGTRTAMPRQQTLRALIDYSYDLLNENEKMLWSRLSVFSGGWSLEAVEEICSDKLISKFEILDVLSGLVEKSIIIYNDTFVRYNFLETIKQYGKEKLNDANEILKKYLHYYKNLAKTAEPELKGNNSKQWLDKLESEYQNIQSAVEWSLDEGDIEEGISLIKSLIEFWKIRGHYFTARQLLQKILDKKHLICNSSISAVLYSAGTLARIQGDIDQAQKLFEEYLIACRESGDKSEIALAITSLGTVHNEQGNYEKAKICFEESLAMNRELGNKKSIAADLNNLGVLLNSRGDSAQAYIYLEECLSLNRKIGYNRGIAQSLGNLGAVSNIQGDYVKAKKLYEESLEMCRTIGDKIGISGTLNNLGIIARNQGDYKQEKKYFNESHIIKSEIGDKRGICISWNNLGEMELIQGDYASAKKFIEKSLALSIEYGYKIENARSLNYLGTVTHRLGDYEKANTMFKESLIMSRELSDIYSITEFLSNFAGALIDNTDNLILVASILAVVESTIRSKGIALEKFEQTVYKNTIAKLHEKFSDEEFGKYWEEGKKITLGAAVDSILNYKL